MDQIKLMLVDDHEVIRQGMRTLFEGVEHFDVVAEASNGYEALEVIKHVDPDVILMDITMPDMDGIEATKLIKIARPESKILALTVHEERQFFQKMMFAGAAGYVTKRSLADDVINAIEVVMKNGVYLSPFFAGILLEDYLNCSQGHLIGKQLDFEAEKKKLELLSKREKQIVFLVAEGFRSREIAEQLDIATHTVSRHRARVMDKLELRTTADLVRFAIKAGLIVVD